MPGLIQQHPQDIWDSRVIIVNRNVNEWEFLFFKFYLSDSSTAE